MRRSFHQFLSLCLSVYKIRKVLKKMEIAYIVQRFLKICNLLPLDGIDFKNHRFIHFLQSFVLLYFAVSSCLIFFPYMFINHSLVAITNTMYLCCGYVNASFVYIHLLRNRRGIQKMFLKIQGITDERE